MQVLLVIITLLISQILVRSQKMQNVLQMQSQ